MTLKPDNEIAYKRQHQEQRTLVSHPHPGVAELVLSVRAVLSKDEVTNRKLVELRGERSSIFIPDDIVEDGEVVPRVFQARQTFRKRGGEFYKMPFGRKGMRRFISTFSDDEDANPKHERAHPLGKLAMQLGCAQKFRDGLPHSRDMEVYGTLRPPFIATSATAKIVGLVGVVL